ncbi:hypothetical protein [Sedimentitalea todarodis]|uniref:Uncharacterized protein n=1 Tax=Sedimentitalea todarodis TaxID=1631240 RepID=A0ABU3VCH0_9RHOB|nr:hypothetical protein [Sedimentitalea todarodis]MDU9003434.1 hypothetical protein [Sedimentitalea todarodis]
MATTAYSLLADWNAANRYTSSGETDVILSNTSGRVVNWVLTSSDAAPSLSAAQGHPLLPYQSRAMKVLDGERLWFCGAGASVSLGI